MLLDDSAPGRSPSNARDRPTRTPFGPRRQKTTPDMPDDPLSSPLATLLSHADAAVQTPNTPPPSSPPSSPQKSVPTTFIAPPPLVPPSTFSFESTPIPWKGLPLEAAQWTFSSSELQEIVSKAIRLSARDSFVRILSLQALEVDIVHESERLEQERLAAQAKWRFEVSRRTMLMQALNASAAFSSQGPGPGSEQTDSGYPIIGFIGQLASAIASSDSLLSTILSIADQQSQIALVQHQHWASALGIALRKLNKAHERQGQELKRTQARVQTLEDELEEAWREAEKMAIEFDDLEQEIAESDGSELLGPQDQLDPCPDLISTPKHDLDETGTLGDMTIHTDIAVVLGVTATAVASKATLVNSPSAASLRPVPALATATNPTVPADKSDTRSIRSVKSTRSRRSTREGHTHLARLSSARTRSRATSNASLRLPRALRSIPSTHTSPVDAPPMPTLPPPTADAQGDSFLEMDNVSQEHLRKYPPKRHPEPTLALPTPPQSAGFLPTHVPSIWLESDGGKPTRLSTLDRSHSLQIFSSLTPRKIRRSNLVMSLTGSDRSSDECRSPSAGSASGSSMEHHMVELGHVHELGMTGIETASPTSDHSPISLPTNALAHCRGPSLSLSSNSTGAGVGLMGRVVGRAATTTGTGTRPGSAGARLTTTCEEGGSPRTPPGSSPRRSLVSRASSVILRRLSQATVASANLRSGGSRGVGKAGSGSPSSSRHGGRSRKDRGKDSEENGDEGEGEVMLIGSPHADVFDAP